MHQVKLPQKKRFVVVLFKFLEYVVSEIVKEEFGFWRVEWREEERKYLILI